MVANAVDSVPTFTVTVPLALGEEEWDAIGPSVSQYIERNAMKVDWAGPREECSPIATRSPRKEERTG